MLGLPEPVFLYSILALVGGVIALATPSYIFKLCLSVVCFAAVYIAYQEWVERNNWLVRQAKERGGLLKRRKTFSRSAEKVYSSEHSWYTRIGEYGIAHKDGSVSIAFNWAGVHNRYSDYDEFEVEHRTKLGVLRVISHEDVSIEHHWLRQKSEERIDQYLQYQAKINPNPPEMVRRIINEAAEIYRGLVRTNRVVTVITVKAEKASLLSYFRKVEGRLSTWKKAEQRCLKVYSRIQNEYDEAKLINAEAFMVLVQQIRSPYQPIHEIDWRYDLSEQLITNKPIIDADSELLKFNDRYFKCCVLQNYPDLSIDWFVAIAEQSIDMHISQVIVPKDVQKVLDRNKQQEEDERAVASGKRGFDKLITKLASAKSYRRYLSDNNLPTADNVFILTYHDTDKNKVMDAADKLSSWINKHKGKLRADDDIQMAMFSARLPGQGVYSAFLREDHGDTIAALCPFTTFPDGSAVPESLRITDAGHPVTFAPSKQEVCHEAVVAGTGGGKDTQNGMKIIETYKVVRYDLIELGNTYQFLIEGIGGRYCRAREQIINPMAPYKDVAAVKAKSVKNNTSDYANLQITLGDILLPVFKGFGKQKYTKSEEVVIGRVIDWVYAQSSENEAPVLPDLIPAFTKIEKSSEKQEVAAKALASDLEEFLQTPTGARFTQQDQYTISEVANAIDFAGMSGELFNYMLSFTASRLASNAMSRGLRAQIILNEYKVLLESAPEVIEHITYTIDRMGRKDWVGLTRISQGMEEIQRVDSEAIDSIKNVTLLSRKTKHKEIGKLLQVPPAAVADWALFEPPEQLIKKRRAYREALVCEANEWFRLLLKFPPLLLDVMNTVGADKNIREKVFATETDAMKRLELLKKLMQERDLKNSEEPSDEQKETTSSTTQPVVAPLL